MPNSHAVSLPAIPVDPFAAQLYDCTTCPRLANFLRTVRQERPGYHAKAVAPFGDRHARLLIVGLAPGMHGANRSGRPFTGDYAGILLYSTMHRFGFASAPVSVSADDDLRLLDCRLTNAVKCLPPENKPLPDEIRTCNAYLAQEIAAAPEVTVILALGTIAHRAVLMAAGLKQAAFAFAHGARHQLPDGRVLFDSYHCSRYNTQTRRLTEQSFHDVFSAIRSELDRR
jgi:uracil-DNA glycosylase family 4